VSEEMAVPADVVVDGGPAPDAVLGASIDDVAAPVTDAGPAVGEEPDAGSVPAADAGTVPAAGSDATAASTEATAQITEAGDAASEAAAPVPQKAPRPAQPPGSPKPTTTVAKAIAEGLAASGTRFAFTVPGESFLSLLDAFLAVGIRPVATRHEGAAAFMAEAATQLSGRPQAVLATRTVGAANASIGIHTARQDSVPIVAIMGGVKRPHKGREAFQESDLVNGIGSLAKRAYEPHSPNEALRQVSEGLKTIVTGRPGPLMLVLPEDLLDERVTGEVTPAPSASQGPAADRAAVRQVLKWLAASERAVIIAGGGVLRARATKRLVALSEALAVPVIASWRRADVFPNDHAHYLGMTGYWAAPTVRQRIIDADVVLVLGARLSEPASFNYRIPGRDQRWAHVDLEPRHAGAGLTAPTLSVAADASRFLDAVWSDLRGAALDAEMRDRRLARLAADRAAYLEASRVDTGDWSGPGVHPGKVVAALQEHLPSNAIITTDAGNFSGWAARGYRFRRPGTYLGPTSGAMGFGLPAAIAASMLYPDRPVVALAGDGGFAMTMNELETAVREGTRPIAIVFDNGQYGTIRMHQEREGRAITASDLGPIDFAAVARASGALGFTVTDDAGIVPALTEALASARPCVIHLSVDRRWVSVDKRP